MNLLDIRKSLDAAIDRLKELAFCCNSEPVEGMLRRAYKHLKAELAEVDQRIIDAPRREAA